MTTARSPQEDESRRCSDEGMIALEQAKKRGRKDTCVLREEAAFEKALSVYRARTHLVASVRGLDYSDGKTMTLNIYEAAAGSPQAPDQ